jgi:hypothetical protein
MEEVAQRRGSEIAKMECAVQQDTVKQYFKN